MTFSSFIPPMPIRVFNSNSLSTITSVGIHALVLLLVFPRLTSLSANDPEKAARNVKLIDLSQAEQSRLPSPSPSSSDTPQIANTPLGDIPVVDSPAQQTTVPNYLSNLPAPPTLPALPSLPPLYGNSNLSGLPIAPPPRSLPIAPIFPPRSLPMPPQTQTPRLPDGIENAQAPQRPDFGRLRPPVPIDDLINQGKGDRPQPGEIAANTPINQNPVNNGNVDPSDDRISRLVAATLQGADNLRYNGNNTSDQETLLNDALWMRKTGQLLKRNQFVTIQGTYPRAACGLQLKGSPIYNVVVDGQGNLAQPPFLTQSSGYGVLNNQGLQDVRSRGFSQSTRVTVVFNPDPSVCPQIATGSQPTELPGTQTPPVQETPPVTPPSEARRNPPETPKPQEKPPVTPPSEARRNPPETPKPQENPPVTPPSEARRNPPETPIPQEKPPIPEATPEARINVPEPLPPVEPPGNIPPAPAAVRKEPEESVINDNAPLGSPAPRKEE